MAVKTRAQLQTANTTLFGNGKDLRGDDEQAFNADLNDSIALPSELFKDITKAQLATAITNATIIVGTRYRITDATDGVVVVWGIDSNVISTNAYIEGNYDGSTWTISKTGNYKLDVDWFIPTDNTYATSPTTSEDDNKGYANGSVWIDSTTNIWYLCTDVGTGTWIAQSGDNNTFTWSPGITPDGVVCTAAALSGDYSFNRVGNIVNLNFVVDLDIDFSAGNPTFTIDPSTLPIPSASPIISGIGQVRSNSSNTYNCFVQTGTQNFTIRSSSTAGTTNYTVYFSVQYSVN